ncbi:MAG: CHASE2 domain-containing protein, partial [bacterium]|nr:CHASE2 domain-containing protein [bacterium]
MKLLRLTEFRVALLATFGMIFLYLGAAQTPLFRNLEAKTLDLRFQLRGASVPKVPISLVLVDDKSIRALGRWPWSRERFAQLVRRLRAAGAKVIAFDILFLEPDENLTGKTLRSLRRSLQSILPEGTVSQILAQRLL